MGNAESTPRSGSRRASGGPPEDADGFEPQDEVSSSYWRQFRDSYDEIIDSIIRPPRYDYATQGLGPAEFEYGGRKFARTDFEIKNRRGLKLVCSHWHPARAAPNPADTTAPAGGAEPEAPPHLATDQPCMIYLHSHVSCRIDAIPLLRTLLAVGVSVLAFDFAGHGQSEGEYVSLGWFERDDVHDVIAHMREKGFSGTLGLWGHYTGAVAALLHGDRDPTIACLVLEGAVADVRQLVTEWVAKGREQGYSVPQIVVAAALRMIRRTVRQRAGFDAFELRALDRVPKCFIPALFVVAQGDPVVDAHHGRQLHEAYAGDKNLIECPGDNLSGRSQFLLDSAAIFVGHALRVDPSLALEAPAEALGTGGLRLQLSPPWGGHYAGADRVRLGGGTGAVIVDEVGGTAHFAAADRDMRAEMAAAAAAAEAEEEEMVRRALQLSLDDAKNGGGAGAHAEEAAGRVDGNGARNGAARDAPLPDWTTRAPGAGGGVGAGSGGGATEEDSELQRAIALSLQEAAAQQEQKAAAK